MSRIIKSESDADNNVIQTVNGTSFNLSKVSGYSFQAVVDVAVPAALGFVDGDVSVANDEITETAHPYVLGLKGQLTSSGTLPAGLALATDYFIIVVDVNTYQLALTLNDALAGTQVDITAAAGGGTHTYTPTALAGATITHQQSNNDSDFFDVAAADSVTVDATFVYTATNPQYKFVRLQYTLTAGLFNVTNNVILRGSK